MKTKTHTFASYSIVTHSQEDLETLAKCLTASIGAYFMKQPGTSNNVVGIAVNGSLNAFKSGFSDNIALGALPETIEKRYLSFYGDPVLQDKFQVMSGHSRAHGRLPVNFSWSSSMPELFWERFDLPGIHIDQNTPPEECASPWMEIILRAPLPQDPENRATILTEDEDDTDPKLKEMFSYAEEKHLRRAGVLRAFKNAVRNEADMPRLVTLNVLDQRLVNSERFAIFTDMMQRIKKNPQDVSKILQETYEQLRNTAPSAIHTHAEDPDLEDDATERAWSFDNDQIDTERKIFFESVVNLGDSELELADATFQQQVRDIRHWHDAYQKQRGGLLRYIVDENTHSTPPAAAAKRKPPKKILQSFEDKTFNAGELIFNLGEKKVYLIDHQAREKQRKEDAVSLYDVAPYKDLTDEECLLLLALYQADGEPVSRAELLESLYQNHQDFTLDRINVAVSGLRQKLTELGRRTNLNAKDYLPVVPTKGYALSDATREDGSYKYHPHADSRDYEV